MHDAAGSGGHRYIFFLYKQPKNLDISFLDLNNRTNFNLAEFAEKTGLGGEHAGWKRRCWDLANAEKIRLLATTLSVNIKRLHKDVDCRGTVKTGNT